MEVQPDDAGAWELASARFYSSHYGPASAKIAAAIREVRDSLRRVEPDRITASKHFPEAARTVVYACDIFLGWHESADEPGEIDIEETGTSLVLRRDKVRFELDGTRWRRGGILCADLDVANELGRPMAWLEGLVEGVGYLRRTESRNHVVRKTNPVYIGVVDAAATIGVPVEVLEGWVGAQVSPYYRLPGCEHVLFKTDEIKQWAKSFGERRGGLASAPKIELMIDNGRAADIVQIPATIRAIDGLRQLSLGDAVSGIYFLCQENEVVYVGQSVNVAARIGSHGAESIKKFDRAFFICCPCAHLDTMERQFIDTLDPKYNGDSLTRSNRNKRASAPASPVPHEGGAK